MIYVAAGRPSGWRAAVGVGAGPDRAGRAEQILATAGRAGVRGPMRATFEVSGCRGFLLGARRERDSGQGAGDERRRERQRAAADRHEPARVSAPSGINTSCRKPARNRIRLVTFAALALYGTVRWGTLMRPAPIGRLLGLCGARRRARRCGAAGSAATASAPRDLADGRAVPARVPDRRACSGTRSSTCGSPSAPATSATGWRGCRARSCPYSAPSSTIRLVIALGAAVLLLDAAIVLAFAPAHVRRRTARGGGAAAGRAGGRPIDARAPAVPLSPGAAAVRAAGGVHLGRADSPRCGRHGARAGALLAGIVAALVAPRLDQHKPWLNYRAWTGSVADAHVDSFDWNQTYGPLHWPHSGHEVLTVDAKTADYWKAENLDMFNGYAWVLGAAAGAADAAARQRCRARGLDTEGPGHDRGDEDQRRDRARRGARTARQQVPGGVRARRRRRQLDHRAGRSVGGQLQVTSYSPHPSAAQLRDAGNGYPWLALSRRPDAHDPADRARRRRSSRRSRSVRSTTVRNVAEQPRTAEHRRVMNASPYAGAYALAQHLAARAPTPYAFVAERAALSLARLHLQPVAAHQPLSAGQLPVQRQARLLPAVLGLDGAAAADGRPAGARRGRVHAGDAQRQSTTSGW